MITEEEYLKAKKIVDTYESEQLNKHIVSGRSELFFKFIDEHYSHSSDNYRNELKNSFTEWNLKNCH